MHGACGVWGILCVGIFHEDKGLIASEIELLGVQFLGMITIIAWTVIATYCTCKLIDKTMKLRVRDVEEDKGLDIAEHSCLTSSLALSDVKLYFCFNLLCCYCCMSIHHTHTHTHTKIKILFSFLEIW